MELFPCVNWEEWSPKILEILSFISYFGFAYCLVNFTLEIIFTVELFIDGHKYWGIFQITIAFIIPYVVEVITGSFFIKELSEWFEKGWWKTRPNMQGIEEEGDDRRDGGSQIQGAKWNTRAVMFILWMPLANFLGGHYVLLIIMSYLKHKNKELASNINDSAIKITQAWVKTSNTMDQHLGLIFKFYLSAKSIRYGVSEYLLILELVYVIYEHFRTIYFAFKYSQFFFHCWDKIFLIFLTTTNKIATMFGFIALLLSIKLYAFIVIGIVYLNNLILISWYSKRFPSIFRAINRRHRSYPTNWEVLSRLDELILFRNCSFFYYRWCFHICTESLPSFMHFVHPRRSRRKWVNDLIWNHVYLNVVVMITALTYYGATDGDDGSYYVDVSALFYIYFIMYHIIYCFIKPFLDRCFNPHNTERRFESRQEEYKTETARTEQNFNANQI